MTIEVLFSNSEAGSLYSVKCKAVRPQKMTDEVLPLSFMLDMGDIRQPVDSEYRALFIDEMYGMDQFADDSDYVPGEFAQGPVSRLERFKQRLTQDTIVRIWYNERPSSLCGLRFVCNILKDYDCNVRIVGLPRTLVHDDGNTTHLNWIPEEPSELDELLQFEEPLTHDEVCQYASEWARLVDENSPLRAVVNGSLISVPEDFYDFLIFKELPDEPTREVRVVGHVLGNYMIGVWPEWINKRIRHGILEGTIELVRDGNNMKHRIIRKCTDKISE